MEAWVSEVYGACAFLDCKQIATECVVTVSDTKWIIMQCVESVAEM